MAQGDPTALLDRHFELQLVNLTVSGDFAGSNGAAVNHHLNKTSAAFDSLVRTRAVQRDGITQLAFAVLWSPDTLRDREGDLRCESDFRFNGYHTGPIELQISRAGRSVAHRESKRVSEPIRDVGAPLGQP